MFDKRLLRIQNLLFILISNKNHEYYFIKQRRIRSLTELHIGIK